MSLLVALGIVCCLRVIVWREQARERKEIYQMSEAWRARVHLWGQKGRV